MDPRIGETRQQQQVELSYDALPGKPRGLLAAVPPEGRFRHLRRTPPEDLRPWIEHWWHVAWDLRGCEPFQAATLPHPNVYLTFEHGEARIGGVHTSRFERVLTGQGCVTGIKFRSGCFRPFFTRSVSEIRNRTIAAATVFGPRIDRLAPTFGYSGGDPAAQVDSVLDLLRQRLPAPDPSADLANLCVNTVLENPQLLSVDSLASEAGMAKRSLQRLFSDYVGVPAKWVIRRYRLFELLDRIQTHDAQPDWPALALDLGYFDQAHMINDFRSITGLTPSNRKPAPRSTTPDTTTPSP